MRILALSILSLCAAGAYAQHDVLIDRAILEREQQAEDFALRQQQRQREQSATTDSERRALYNAHARQRSALEREHRAERQRLYERGRIEKQPGFPLSRE